MLSSSSCCCAEAGMASPPRAASVVGAGGGGALGDDRLGEPDWLSSGEGMTSISFDGFIALRLLFRFLESHPLLVLVWKGPWETLPVDRVRASVCDGLDWCRLISEE